MTTDLTIETIISQVFEQAKTRTKLLTAHNVTTIEAALKLYQWGKL